MAASTPEITRSMITQQTRRSDTPRAWRLSPEEYRSRPLPDHKVKMASTRNGTSRPEGSTVGRPAIGSEAFLIIEATAAPSTSRLAADTSPPSDDHQKMAFLLVEAGR